MFKDFFNESYNISGKGNPYLGLDKASLKRKKASFETQIADLQNKLMRSNLGASGNKNSYTEELNKLELKLSQVNFALKGKK